MFKKHYSLLSIPVGIVILFSGTFLISDLTPYEDNESYTVDSFTAYATHSTEHKKELADHIRVQLTINGKETDYHTFSKFSHLTIDVPGRDVTAKSEFPEFTLESVPSIDKRPLYSQLAKNIDVGDLDRYAFDDSGMLISYADANMVIRARPASGGTTRVEINTKVTATGKGPLAVFFSILFSLGERQVVLDSKGWLEREYFDRLDAALQGVATGAGLPDPHEDE